MTKSRRERGLDPQTKEVKRLPAAADGAMAVVVESIIPARARKLEDLVGVRQFMNAYLTKCREDGRVPCNAGMALALGVSKSTFEQGFPEYGDEYKELYNIFRTVVEDWVVQKLFEPKLSIAALFYLKNLGWRDDRGMQVVDDNRTVNNIIIQTDKGVQKIDLETGVKENKKIKRGRGRPKKYDGVVEIVPVEE